MNVLKLEEILEEIKWRNRNDILLFNRGIEDGG